MSNYRTVFSKILFIFETQVYRISTKTYSVACVWSNLSVREVSVHRCLKSALQLVQSFSLSNIRLFSVLNCMKIIP